MTIEHVFAEINVNAYSKFLTGLNNIANGGQGFEPSIKYNACVVHIYMQFPKIEEYSSRRYIPVIRFYGVIKIIDKLQKSSNRVRPNMF